MPSPKAGLFAAAIVVAVAAGWWAMTTRAPQTALAPEHDEATTGQPAHVVPSGRRRSPLASRDPQQVFLRAYPDARVIETRRTRLDDDRVRQVRLWSVPSARHRHFRSVELWKRDPQEPSSEPELLAAEVMLADRLAVTVTHEIHAAAFEAEARNLGAEITRRYPFSPVWQIRLPEVALDGVPRWLRRLQEIAHEIGRPGIAVHPDYVFFPARDSGDTRYDDQWQWPAIGAPAAWDETVGSTEVPVAVIDTGLYQNEDEFSVHNDFRFGGGHNIWINPGEDLDGDGALGDTDDLNGIDDDGNGLVDDLAGWDFADDDPLPEDLLGHGTQVAGLIGSAGDNSFGIAGTAWRASLIPLKAGDRSFPWSTLAICLDYARSLREAGADLRITNHSYGATVFEEVPAMSEAIERASESGLLMIAAAGNEGRDLDNSPGRYLPASFDAPNILTVASTDADDCLSETSSFGSTSVDLGAPGVNLLTLNRLGSFDEVTGTSFAAALVSGTAALAQARNPKLDAAQLRELVVETGTPASELQGCTTSGRRLNLGEALATVAATTEPYAFWQWQHWPGDFASRPEASPEADLDRDGADNLLEYVLMTDPRLATRQAAHGGRGVWRPTWRVSSEPPPALPEGRYLVLRYLSNPRATDVAVRFERHQAGRHHPWQELAPAALNTTPSTDETKPSTVHAWFSLADTDEALLIRLRVSPRSNR